MTSAGSVTRISVRSNAKLNLFLRVLGRLPSGFHEIESIFHTVAFGDNIDVVASAEPGVRVDMSFDDDTQADLPRHDDNLAFIAATRLLERVSPSGGVEITIRKRIPIGAGLGGGSGNAAAVLVAVNELLDAGVDRATLATIGQDVGSDVPYCLLGGTALVTGRGEKLTALPSPESMFFVIGLSSEPLLTRSVYAKWDEVGSDEGTSSAEMTMALSSDGPTAIAELFHNDLETAAFALRPELRSKKEAMIDAEALGAGMTGSGPTIFGVATSEQHAKEIAARVEGSFDRVVVSGSAVACVERLD
jgi:4-diphosphocytidyl-2-C-methyl-D-erythritol kinase